MKLMLTSFGIENAIGVNYEHPSLFYRMPPVSFRCVKDVFMPDYDLLLLCDTLVMDETSFGRLTQEPASAYMRVAETYAELRREGRVELVDFGALLRSNADLLNRMIEHDIRLLDQWVAPLRDSITMWRHFSEKSMQLLEAQEPEWFAHPHFRDAPPRHELYPRHAIALMHEVAHMVHCDAHALRGFTHMVDEAIRSSTKRREKEYREPLRETLRSYLSYVNANLVLSNELGIGFHDWLDFTPFYATKFLVVGKDGDPVADSRSQVEKLFTIPFPELAITNTRGLMRALNDKRVAELRQLIGDAVAGKVQFDQQFAKAVLQDVLAAEGRSRRWRSIVGYLTMPFGLIPWVGPVADKAVSETVGAAADSKIKTKHRWFYMLSEIAEAAKSESEQGAPKVQPPAAGC